jgi:hypothetical protein
MFPFKNFAPTVKEITEAKDIPEEEEIDTSNAIQNLKHKQNLVVGQIIWVKSLKTHGTIKKCLSDDKYEVKLKEGEK